MVEPRSAPPWRWLLGDRQQRAAAWTYRVQDTAIGMLNLGIHHGMRVLPIDWCSWLGAGLGLIGRLRYPHKDVQARGIWRRLRPDAVQPQQIDAAMGRLWRGIGRTMAEYSVLDRMWSAGRIAVQGIEHVEAARAAGRPRLILMLHIGNWETIAASLYALGHDGGAIYLPPASRYDDRIAADTRKRYGCGRITHLVPPGPDASRTALRALKENEGFFMIAVDEFIRGRVQAPAFGRPLAVNGSNIAYAARLAAMTGADVIPAFSVRQGEQARFEVTFVPPVAMAATGDRHGDVAENVRRINDCIEPIIRSHLDEWFYVLDLELDA